MCKPDRYTETENRLLVFKGDRQRRMRSDCQWVWGFFFEVMKCSKIRYWWPLYNLVIMLFNKTPGLYVVTGWLLVCEYLSKAQIKSTIYPLIKKMEIGNGGKEWEKHD